MEDLTGIIGYSTGNYETMRDFFEAIEFSVSEERHQLMPLFERKRGSFVERAEIVFNLEEAGDPHRRADFNLFLFGYSHEDMDRILPRIGDYEQGSGISDTQYSVRSPDGGTIIFCVPGAER